ncbi:DUF1622 domain-containing protein [Streptomyces sp. NPDC002120]|uniref:DUF1622 domain-containing protein n=1 Tax=Streptomyces sp. NPDC002120 TaxID=3364631 RepID=UPI0036C97EDC
MRPQPALAPRPPCGGRHRSSSCRRADAGTAVAPGFTEIGRLAAIAAIRTILNFFLAREIAQERIRLRRLCLTPVGGEHALAR